MANSRRRRNSGQAHRDGSLIASYAGGPDLFERWLGVHRLPPVDYSLYSDPGPLLEVEDRREFFPGDSPLAWEPARTRQGSPARLVVSGARRTDVRPAQHPFRSLAWPSPVVAFKSPQLVNVCSRRQARKEVLHAVGVAGSKGLRRPRRSIYSEISCKR